MIAQNASHQAVGTSRGTFGPSRSLSAGVKDTRLGVEISVIQTYADKIVKLLKVRDPLSERVHLKSHEFLGYSVSGIATELTRRVLGRNAVSNRAAGA